MRKPKPNNLAAALKEKAQGSNHSTANTGAVQIVSIAKRTRSRTGKASFRLIQAKHPEKLMQDMVVEAFNDLFAKYNVPQTARSGEEAAPE
jgi:hypothetical protein